jgi:hypothetical protein
MALTTNLVSYYKFDESSGNAADSVGSNTLTNINTVTFVAGKINNSTNLVRASSQYLRITNASQSGLGFTGDFSISSWINFSSFSTANLYGISSKWRGSQGYFFFVGDGSNRIGLRINGTTASVSWTPSTSTWYHVVCVYTASAGSVDFYINGSQQGTTQTGLPTSITATDEQFAISTVNGTAVQDTPDNSYMDGKIDETGAWSRTLNSSEVAELHAGGNGLSYPFVQTLTMVAATGTFVLTGIDVILGRIYTMAADIGSYVLTGFNAVLQATGWTNQAKNTSTFTNSSKNTNTWTNQDKS